MLNLFTELETRLVPAEEIFFRWLTRVVVAAILIGSAWIDDAPPLELAAWIIVIYVVARVVMQFSVFTAAVPVRSQLLRTVVALTALVVLGLSFLTVVTFVEQLAILAAG